MIISIDPGKTGAVAIVDGPRLLDVVDMPVFEKEVDAVSLGNIINMFALGFDCHQVVIEQVSARPKQGVVSTFTFGVSYGIIKGVVGAFGIETSYVLPQRWKKDLHLTSDKSDSLMLANELWPEQGEWFRRKKDDGRAEAALIGYWKELFDASE
jgi:crossover junction endodeoxyribonuclease RuvC